MKQVVMLLLFFFLVGCHHLWGDEGLIRNHHNDYLKSENGIKVVVPKKTPGHPLSDNYVIENTKTPVRPVTPLPPSL